MPNSMSCSNLNDLYVCSGCPVARSLRRVDGVLCSWCRALGSDARSVELKQIDLSEEKKSAVIVVDMQNDFIPIDSKQVYPDEMIARFGWTAEELRVANECIKSGSGRSAFASERFGGYQDKETDFSDNVRVISNIQQLMKIREHDLFVFSMDDHPPDSISFESNRPKWEKILPPELLKQYEAATGYADHCVHGSWGQKIVHDLRSNPILIRKINAGTAMHILKGTVSNMEGYSAFFKGKGVIGRDPAPQPGSDAFHELSSGLHELLSANGIERLYVCGTAQNICVCDTAFDASVLGYETVLVNDCCKPLEFETEYIMTPSNTVKFLQANNVLVIDLASKVNSELDSQAAVPVMPGSEFMLRFNGRGLDPRNARPGFYDALPRHLPVSGYGADYRASVRKWDGY